MFVCFAFILFVSAFFAFLLLANWFSGSTHLNMIIDSVEALYLVLAIDRDLWSLLNLSQSSFFCSTESIDIFNDCDNDCDNDRASQNRR